MTAPNDGWQDHERERRAAWLALTPAERLRWLWDAKVFAARALEAARLRRLAKKDGSSSGAPSK